MFFEEHQLENKLMVDVIDTGVGIPEAEQGNLFKIFGKLKRTSGINQ